MKHLLVLLAAAMFSVPVLGQVVTSVETGDKTGIVTSVEAGDQTGIVTSLESRVPADSLCIITTDEGFVLGTLKDARKQAETAKAEAPRREAAIRLIEALNEPETYKSNTLKK